MKPLVLYNTRTRSKEIFEPIEAGHARVYTCGPTVYAPQHIGNLRSQLLADLLKRALLAQGYRVTHVINITDVGHLTDDADAGEDKMERAAAERGKTAQRKSPRSTPTNGCGTARGWVPGARSALQGDRTHRRADRAGRGVGAKGFSYRIEDGIYFDTSKFPRYTEFARLDLDAQVGGARIGDVPDKRNPADFALWKFAAPDVRRQQEWDSPWGRGFPGWHIECSAMSRRYLGNQFDIHTGGVDHIGVHHTNEIAQSECADGVHPWVRFWLHGEFLDFRGEKMAKSTGNLCVLDDLIDRGIAPLAFRYFSLQAHYRQQQTFTDEAIESAATGYDRLVAHAAELREARGRLRGRTSSNRCGSDSGTRCGTTSMRRARSR